MEMIQVLQGVILAGAEDGNSVTTYRKPRQNRHMRRAFCLVLIRNLRTGTTGIMKIMKSVAMFIHEVRYQTGKV